MSWLARSTFLALGLAVGPAGAAGKGAESTELLVFAASSLREAFGKIGEEFKREHPGVRVTFNLAGSQELKVQIEHGAAADVVACADRRQMDALKSGGWVLEDRIFARNEPVLAISSANRAAIQSFEDLRKAKRIVVAAPQVPIGGYTVEILERAYRRYGPEFRRDIEARIASTELNVRQVLAKVQLGEADAGIVYRTDVGTAQARVAVLPIPAELNANAEYPVALVKSARHAGLAQAWIDLLTSSAGQRILGELGFLPPGIGEARRPR